VWEEEDILDYDLKDRSGKCSFAIFIAGARPVARNLLVCCWDTIITHDPNTVLEHKALLRHKRLMLEAYAAVGLAGAQGACDLSQS
jgi:hypothetical protein